jgi:hypothetical protein
MDVFVFVTAIVGIGTFGGIIREVIKNDAKKHKNQNSEEVNARFEEMEQRIQTLERIVTDQKSQLKEKINSL